MQTFMDEKEQMIIDINNLEKEVEDLEKKLNTYDSIEKSDIQIKYEELEEKIEKLKQTPM